MVYRRAAGVRFQGNLDIADVFCNCIRQVTPADIITTLYTLPQSPPPNRTVTIEGLAIDSQDNLYFTEWFGNQVVKVCRGRFVCYNHRRHWHRGIQRR